MNDRKFEEKDIILKCNSDFIIPCALVYILYIILHGHISPGGGFQGGVLNVAVVCMLYLGHGYETTVRTLSFDLNRKVEGLAVTLYICIAMVGVVMGAQFCQNVAFQNGNIGDLISSGTIAWMDEAVGLNVFTGVCVVALSMIGLLAVNNDRKE